MLDLADVSLVVTTPEPTAIADAYALIKCVMSPWHPVRGPSIRRRAGGIGPRGARLALVVNQARHLREALDVHRRISGVAERFLDLRVPLLGTLAEDPAVGDAARAKRPLLLMDDRHAPARDIRALAASLAQHLRPIAPQARPRLSSLWRSPGRSSDVRHQDR
jgi:flagellar biosynthesis protein FlhG